MDLVLPFRFVRFWSEYFRWLFLFKVTLTYNQNQSDLNTNPESNFELRFSTIKHQFFSNAHQLLNKKLCLFLNETHSLKQFIRVTKITLLVFQLMTFIDFSYYISHQFHWRRSLVWIVLIDQLFMLLKVLVYKQF